MCYKTTELDDIKVTSMTKNEVRILLLLPDVFTLLLESGTTFSFFMRPKTSLESLSSAGDKNGACFPC